MDKNMASQVPLDIIFFTSRAGTFEWGEKGRVEKSFNIQIWDFFLPFGSTSKEQKIFFTNAVKKEKGKVFSGRA